MQNQCNLSIIKFGSKNCLFCCARREKISQHTKQIMIRIQHVIMILMSFLLLLNIAQAQEGGRPLLTFELPVMEAVPGEEICLNLVVDNFQDVASMQFGMAWDTAALVFDKVDNFTLRGLSQSNFAFNRIQNGKISLAWFDSVDFDGESIPDSTAMFQICFTVRERPDISFAYVAFSGQTTPEEVLFFDGDGYIEVLSDFRSGGINIQGGNNISFSGDVVARSLCGVQQAEIQLSDITGTAPFSFSWTGPEGFESQERDVAISDLGAYNVIVTDADSNSKSGSFFLSTMEGVELDTPLISSIDVFGTACEVPDGSAILNFRTPGFDYDINWFNGADTPELIGLLPGFYSVSVSLNDECFDNRTFTIPAEGGIDLERLEEPFEDCRDTTAVIGVLTDGSEKYIYEWSTSEATATIRVNTPGAYQLTVTDESIGCFAVFEYEVAAPASDFNFDFPRLSESFANCFDTTASIGYQLEADTAMAYTFSWSTTDSTANINVTEGGDYQFEARLNGTSCVFQDTFTLEDKPKEIDLGVVGEIMPGSSCERSSAIISLVYPDERELLFTWSTAESSDQIEVTQAGTYSLTVTDESTGCNQFLTFDIAEDSLNPTFEGTEIQVSCLDEVFCDTLSFANITAIPPAGFSGPFVFDWSNGVTEVSSGSNITVSSTANISLTVTSADGCTEQIDNITADCPEENPLANLRLLTYLECSASDNTPLLTVEALNQDLAPFTFDWSNGLLDTSYFRSQVVFDTFEVPYAVDVIYADTSKTLSNLGGNSQFNCEQGDNNIVVTAPTVTAQQGEQIVIPIVVTTQQGFSGLSVNTAWNDCQLRLDSIIDYTGGQPDTIRNQRAGEWQFDYSSFSDANGMPLDSFTVQEYFFTVRASSGISPFIFSLNEQPESTNEDVFPVIPAHGYIQILQDPEAELVFPGDTDTDNTVDHLDLFNIGLFFGETGPDRRLPLLQAEEPGLSWGGTGVGLDPRHADADGNGTINSMDIEIVKANFGLVPGPKNGNTFVNSDFTVQITADSISRIGNNSLDITLENNGAATPIYGLAFSVNYDPLIVDPSVLGLDISQSSLAGPENNLLLQIQQVFPEEGRIDLAIVRTDQEDITGTGLIGQLNVAILDTTATELALSVEEVVVLTAQGSRLAATGMMAEIPVASQTVNTLNLLPDNAVRIFPNPSTHNLYVAAPNLRVEEINVYDINGQLRKHFRQAGWLEVEELHTGFYLIKIKTDRGIAIKKWIKE